MKIKLISTAIRGFWEKLIQTIENTRFSMMGFLHLYVINHKKDRLIKKESEVIK